MSEMHLGEFSKMGDNRECMSLLSTVVLEAQLCFVITVMQTTQYYNYPVSLIKSGPTKGPS